MKYNLKRKCDLSFPLACSWEQEATEEVWCLPWLPFPGRPLLNDHFVRVSLSSASDWAKYRLQKCSVIPQAHEADKHVEIHCWSEVLW